MTTVTKKIDTLDPMTDAVADNDKLLMLDMSAEAVSMTKLMTMNQIPISLAAQLSTDVVENSKIKDGAVTTSKLDQAGTTQAVSTATIRDDAVTFAKLQNVDAYSVIGKKGTGAGDADEIVAGENAVLGRVGAGDIAFSKLATTQLANTNARTVIGNATNASATPTAIASGTDGYVLRQNGDALGFGTLTDKSLATGAVTAGKIATGGVSASTQFAAGVVDTAALKDANVTLAKMAANSVDSSKIVDGSIVAADLASNAVTTVKIADAQVTTAKIADNSVTEAKLGTIKRTLVIRVTAPDDEVLVFNYGNFFPWPVTLNNFTVIDARINLSVPSSNGAVTAVLSNQGGTLATLTLAQGTTGMAATGSISASYKTALTNNFLGINITGAGVGAKGLCLSLVLEGAPE